LPSELGRGGAEDSMTGRCVFRTATSFLVLAFSIIPAAALNVRFVGQKPGLETPDGAVEIINTNPHLWYRVVGSVSIANPGAHLYCTEGTECATTWTTNQALTLPPCNFKGKPSCISSWSAELPTCHDCKTGLTEDCNKTSCDNRTGSLGCPSCPNTPVNQRWCVHLTDLVITILATSPNGVDWTTVNQVTDYGTGVYQESTCEGQQPLRDLCRIDNFDPNVMCFDEEE
jgi:hypothetical protein